MRLGNRDIPTWLLAGVTAGVLIVAFFLFCRLLGAIFITELHFVNYIFIVVAIWVVVRDHHLRRAEYPYFAGYLAGVKTAALAGLLSNFFLLIYLRFIDPGFMSFIRDYAPLGNYMSPLIIALVLFTEQVSAAVVITLIFMQLYKPKRTT